MDGYQELQIEANSIIKGTHFYRYNENSYFANQIRLLKEGIKSYLLETEPELALKITEKIIRSDGRIIERTDDSSGSVGYELNDFCILWLEAASRCTAPSNNWIQKIIKLNDGDDYGCRNDLLPNVNILLSMEEMQELYEYYKKQYLGIADKAEPDGRASYNKLTYAVSMGQVAKAMKNPELYEESVIIRSPEPNDMQMLDILERYLDFDNTDKVLAVLSERNWEKRFKTDALYLKEKAYKVNGDIPELKKVQKQIYLEYPSLDRLKDYLKDLDLIEHKNIIEEALIIAEKDTDLCRGITVLLEYRQYETVLKMVISRQEELYKGFYGSLLGILEILKGKEQHITEVLIYRALLSDILNIARSKAYRYAASYYRKLFSLDEKIDFYPEEIEGHEEFCNKLKEKHYRKYSFWNRVEK